MSYILQALKRSENEQKTPELPGISTEQSSDMMFIEETQTTPVWLPVLVGATIVSIAVLGGMWVMLKIAQPLPSLPETEVTAVVAPAEVPIVEETVPAIADEATDMRILGKREVAKVKPSGSWPPQEMQPRPVVTAPAKPASAPTALPPEPAPAISLDLETPVAAVVEQPPGDNTEPLAQLEEEELMARFQAAIAATQDMNDTGLDPMMAQPVPMLTEKSQALQDAVPSLSFSQHIYSSDASKRWVKVNGQTVHEGETVSEDLVLERIDPQSVVMSLHGYMFSLPALTDW
ncbi:hypothetical protein DU002_04470 [Corallincola holothuriorum]|uniref:Type II secretion system protein GspB C-terminal domain-containing protein n=1 Tax=Corallincola holothuriorum TaxID=2282215 RepID=A0A368NR31_9GAMM|nr:general secretion pathway protein GspB [Corallincola holothuriorum]RCU51731.1 hypothetical protein DU002_04470 [Corallincola holothuriorum]